MILIVVFVHPIAANHVEIGVTLVDFLANRVYVASVLIIVDGICLSLPHNTTIKDI